MRLRIPRGAGRRGEAAQGQRNREGQHVAMDHVAFRDLPSKDIRKKDTRLSATASCSAAVPSFTVDVRPLDASFLPRYARLRPRDRAVVRQVFVGAAHPQLEGEQPPEAMRHPVRSVMPCRRQLDRFLADFACLLPNETVAPRHCLATRARIRLQAGGGGQKVIERACSTCCTCRPSVLQRLQAADLRAELHSVAGVLDGGGQDASSTPSASAPQCRDARSGLRRARRARRPRQAPPRAKQHVEFDVASSLATTLRQP